MSESALAAAICPYEKGSSTIGVKKSTVCTRARWRSRRYTPASSKVFELTSTFRFSEMGSCGKTCRRACWLNLEAHPAQDESEVSLRICSRDIEVHLLSRNGFAAHRAAATGGCWMLDPGFWIPGPRIARRSE